MDQPVVVSIVVASHGRPLRLRWLLNALEDQTATEAWELIVVHDYDAATAGRVLEDHPLAASGRLRHLAIASGTGSPSRQRNIGWREASAGLIAFTDDDCRPDPGWLEALLEAARQAPGCVVQGRTRPDPLEGAILAAPHVRTLWIEPVGPYAQTCNILYPRALLERLGGFDERAITGEDVDLSLRARVAGAAIVAAPAARVFHAVESHTLPGILRENLKWRHLAYLVRRHPQLRRQMPLGLFWDEEHLHAGLALAGGLAARRYWPAAALAVPWAVRTLERRGRGRPFPALALLELPGQACRQTAELVGLAAGSLRHGRPVL